MAGALHALAERTRFYPRHADQILGTSAGSVLAVLGGAGVPPWLLIPESSGNVYHGMVNAEGNLEISPDLWTRIVRKRRTGLPRFAPGSISLTLAGLRQGRSTFLKTLSGLAPVGFISTFETSRGPTAGGMVTVLVPQASYKLDEPLSRIQAWTV